ncbi:hypothetical protein ACU686_19290 [Yinghuangia aomiensis]
MNWMLGNGGGYKTGDKYTVNSQANVDTMTWINDNLVKTGLTEPNPGTKDRKRGLHGLLRRQRRHGEQQPDDADADQGQVPEPQLRHRGHPGQDRPAHRDPRRLRLGHGVQEERQEGPDQGLPRRRLQHRELAEVPAGELVRAGHQVGHGQDGRRPGQRPAQAVHRPAAQGEVLPAERHRWDVLSPKIREEQLGLAVSGKSPKDVLDQLQKEAEAAVQQQK